eukprot:CAMPEP_0118680184 /NCGR_PEP_ID=MMETSP0800-20121206/4212_1 /TAXON_ID=210618 ORGANISM="Striatella unipunctata, Strain CCMP2910" /NCGR_SAMPLE_ID=MMETSP0800 /ASSEMBLY_ACC=CAM_ASM_000638 /LENGTH=378 /DNA_ID=CAMNT_0006576281 /DNA_START=23 /DNA_END=1159 /DNA_ORIENTATION=+
MMRSTSLFSILLEPPQKIARNIPAKSLLRHQPVLGSHLVDDDDKRRYDDDDNRNNRRDDDDRNHHASSSHHHKKRYDDDDDDYHKRRHDDDDDGFFDFDLFDDVFDDVCFSGASTVHVQGKGSFTPISELRVGDHVLVDAKQHIFEPVYAFAHREISTLTTFVQLQTKSTSLELSDEHFVFANNKLVRASDVHVGDDLSNDEKVMEIVRVDREGLYAPLTPSGKIVVDGILASSYVAIQKGEGSSAFFRLKNGMELWFLHQGDVVHKWFAPLRLLCRGDMSLIGMSGYCDAGEKDGMHEYAVLGLKLSSYVEGQSSSLLQLMMLLMILLVLGSFMVLESLVHDTPVLVLIGGVCLLLLGMLKRKGIVDGAVVKKIKTA